MYKVEVIADSSGIWADNSLTFATVEAAKDYAVGLFMRWTLVRRWRVVDTEGTVYAEGPSSRVN